MQAKSGKAREAITPIEPAEALEADVADPGEMARIKKEQVARQEGKYGSTPVKPFKEQQTDQAEQRQEQQEKDWIEIELTDDDDEPIPGAKYKVILPDGQTVAEGTLDQKGFKRIDGIDPGQCQVVFPEYDDDELADA